MDSVPLLLFLGTAALIAVVFVVVARSTSAPATVDAARANRLRGAFGASLGVVLAVFLLLTLPRLPYPIEAAAPEQVVHVVGKQYSFSLTTEPGPRSLEAWDAEAVGDIEFAAGSLVEFRVTTLDVTHGFGVFSPQGQLLAQTQAMPGYVNRLRLRFDQPGTYTVRCLELCGLSHHVMRGIIEVTGEAR
jgi:cytochrome c oxidase subunit 2